MFQYKCMSFSLNIFLFEYKLDKCMHLFSKTKCIFKYKCMQVMCGDTVVINVQFAPTWRQRVYLPLWNIHPFISKGIPALTLLRHFVRQWRQKFVLVDLKS